MGPFPPDPQLDCRRGETAAAWAVPTPEPHAPALKQRVLQSGGRGKMPRMSLHVTSGTLVGTGRDVGGRAVRSVFYARWGGRSPCGPNERSMNQTKSTRILAPPLRRVKL